MSGGEGRTVVLDPFEQVSPSILVEMRQRRLRQGEIQLGKLEVRDREDRVVGHRECWMSERTGVREVEDLWGSGGLTRL